MTKNKIFISVLILSLVVLTLLSQISAASLFSFDKQVYTYPEQQKIEKEGMICNSGQDLLIRVAPFGCEPAPVRSDLLEENNVLVYCPIQALQLNPAVKIKSIDGVSFTGSSASSEVRGVGFVPSETAKKYGLEQNFMAYQNIGYLSVELKRQPNESAMPDFVEGNLTAKISYSSGTNQGIASTTFYVSESLNDLENTVVPIFNNKAIVSVEEVSKDKVKLSIHDNLGVKLSDLELKEGETSGELKIPGFSVCDASMKVKIDDIAINPSSRARLNVDGSNIELIKGDKFLDGKCTVANINQDSLFRNVEVQCLEDGATSKTSFTLGIQPTVDLEVVGENLKTNLQVGDEIYEYPSGNFAGKKLFIGYIGEDNLGKPVIIIYLSTETRKEDFLNLLSQDRSSIYLKAATTNNIFTISNAFSTWQDLIKTSTFSSGGKNTIVPLGVYLVKGENGINIEKISLQDLRDWVYQLTGISAVPELPEITTLKFAIPENKALSGDVLNNYNSAKQAYAELVENYPQEKRTDSEKTIVEEALEEMISLSASINQNRDLAEFCEEFAFSFSSSVIPTVCSENQVSNSETSSRAVIVGDSSKTISLVDVIHPDVQDYSVEVYVSSSSARNQRYFLAKDLKASLSSASQESITLTDLTDDTATFKVQFLPTSTNRNPSTLTSQTIKIKIGETGKVGNYEIDLEKINLKRTAKISIVPQFNKGSSSVPFGFKIGIEKRAIQLSPEKTKEAIDNVNKSIETFNKISSAMDVGLKALQGACYAGQAYMMTRATINLFSGEAAARATVINGAGGWKAFCQAQADDPKQNVYSLEDCLLDNSKAIEEEVKYVQEKNKNLEQLDSEIVAKADEEFSKKTDCSNIENDADCDGILNGDEEEGSQFGEFSLQDSTKLKQDYKEMIRSSSTYQEFAFSSQSLNYATVNQLKEIKIYLEMLNNPNLKSSAERKLKALSLNLDTNYNQIISTSQSINPSSGTTSSKIQNPIVKYYEEGDYKGLPALVPVDIENGIYAAMNQEDYISRNLIGFYLGNVGGDGVVDFYSGFKDDKVLYVSLDPSIGSIARFDTKTQELIELARRKITAARTAYKPGATKVAIDGKEIAVEVLSVVSSVLQCQNIMSAEECTVLFNLCDPVVCPPSRCDFGGAYKVNNVIQTGIIGSIALCLPNIKEGVYIPVCLTGIKAGIDNWNSIQTSYRDCLQTSLDTGETVGICDQIRSVYICELFYEKAVPLAKSALPGLINLVTKQKASGGGELLFTDSATYIMDSLESLKETYGVSSQKAFSTKEVTSVGGSFCKNFMSTPIPSNFSGFIEFAGKALQPDSPTQYHARFDETKISSVGTPSSHYKVFYHIFAGNNADVSYSVFLRGESISSNKVVASGTIPAGSYATETKDFTAVPGYKELCISINGIDNCGFKQVSTSFAVDYLTDTYVSKEISQTEISTQKECISGKIGWHTLMGASLGMSPGSAASTLFDPQIYGFDIIRVCSTNNPGEGTDAARWAEVGTCGSAQLKCWLDTKGVKEMLNSPDLLKAINSEGKDLESIGEGTMEDIEKSVLDRLTSEEGYFNEGDLKELIKNIRTLRDQGKYNDALAEIDRIFDKVIFNNQKAELLLLKVEIYSEMILNGLVVAPDSSGLTNTGINNVESSEEISNPLECSTANPCTEIIPCEYQDASDESCTKICYESACENGKCVPKKSSENRFENKDCETVKYEECSDIYKSQRDSCKQSCVSEGGTEEQIDACVSSCDNGFLYNLSKCISN